MTYTVVGLLGRGGMAVVELAVDADGRQVARKRVSLSGSAHHIELARQRIRREAEVLSRLHHPGILPLLAVEDDGTDVVLVMPRMAASLADRVGTGGPLPTTEVVTMGRVLLDALATAHRQGIVHRDIKPGNVLFDHAGRPYLADFGVAATSQFTAGLTDIGTVIGTPGFIAPEQARGGPALPASDVFSLAATLAYALTAKGPFGDGDPFALMALAARGQVDPLPRSVPPRLRRPLTAMMDPRPERRPSAAGALGGTAGTQPNPVAPSRPRRRPPGAVAGGRRGRRTRTVRYRAGPVPATRDRAGRPSYRRHRRTRRLLIIAGVAVVALAAVGLALAVNQPSGPSGSGQVATPPVPAATTVPACTPLPYQPCGRPPAPFTDGKACVAGHADYNGIAADGCEATTDYVAGTELTAHQTVRANLVPADAVDSFRTYVHGNLLNFCTGQFKVTLTAPPGVADQVDVVDGSRVLASAISRDGRPATASAGKPSCISSASTWLSVRVSSVQGENAADFQLTRSGGW